MNTSKGFSKLLNLPTCQGKPLPVLFVGHGSPMNAIENNQFTKKWQQLGTEMPTPQAVLCISAHWLTRGTYVTDMEAPPTIHDFGGFPQPLYNVQYSAPGSPTLASQTIETVATTTILPDHNWGLDHGTWSILCHMYPEAQVPVLQLSIDYRKPAQYHYQLGKELAALRKKGVLVMGSGNMVHNLQLVAWDKLGEPEYGYDWAIEMNEVFKKNIVAQNHQALIEYEKLGAGALKAIPTPDHFYPLLYALSLQGKNDETEIFNDKAVGGSLTMTSVIIG